MKLLREMQEGGEGQGAEAGGEADEAAPALHMQRQFFQKVQGTNHLLCAFWCFTARPLHIGSTSCSTIFQVSNRTIRCIVERSRGCSKDFV